MKMVTQNYNVENGHKHSNDNRITGRSYKSFICAILVFLIFCVVLVLITIISSKSNSVSNSEQYADLQTSSTPKFKEPIDENDNKVNNSNQNEIEIVVPIANLSSSIHQNKSDKLIEIIQITTPPSTTLNPMDNEATNQNISKTTTDTPTNVNTTINKTGEEEEKTSMNNKNNSETILNPIDNEATNKNISKTTPNTHTNVNTTINKTGEEEEEEETTMNNKNDSGTILNPMDNEATNQNISKTTTDTPTNVNTTINKTGEEEEEKTTMNNKNDSETILKPMDNEATNQNINKTTPNTPTNVNTTINKTGEEEEEEKTTMNNKNDSETILKPMDNEATNQNINKTTPNTPTNVNTTINKTGEEEEEEKTTMNNKNDSGAILNPMDNEATNKNISKTTTDTPTNVNTTINKTGEEEEKTSMNNKNNSETILNPIDNEATNKNISKTTPNTPTNVNTTINKTGEEEEEEKTTMNNKNDSETILKPMDNEATNQSINKTTPNTPTNVNTTINKTGEEEEEEKTTMNNKNDSETILKPMDNEATNQSINKTTPNTPTNVNTTINKTGEEEEEEKTTMNNKNDSETILNPMNNEATNQNISITTPNTPTNVNTTINNTEEKTTTMKNDAETTIDKNQNNSKTTTIATQHKIRPNLRNKKIYDKTNKWITSRIFYQMNYFGDSCVNFYDYTCGRNDIEFKHQSENIYTLSSQSNLKKEIYMETFYNSCINYETDFNFTKRTKNVEILTNEIGNFIFTDDSEDDSNVFKLSELFEKLTIAQSNPLFDIGLDFAEDSIISLQITLPEGSALRNGLKSWSSFSYHKKQCLQMENIKTHQSNLNLNEIYESYRECSNNLTTYLNSIENAISNFDCFKNLSAETKSAKIKDIRDSVEKILSILNKEMPLSKTNKIQFEYEEKKYESLRISELKYVMPDIIKWDDFFKSLTGKNYIKSDPKIHVYFLYYFSKMFKTLSEMSKSKLNNALLAIYANDLFMNTVIPRETGDRRDQFCSDLSKQLLPTVWSDLVLQETSSNNHNEYYDSTTIQKLFTQLKDTLKSVLEDDGINWIDDSETDDMRTKIDNLDISLFTSSEKVSSNVQSFDIGHEFQTNLVHLLAFLRRRVYSLAGAPISNKDFFSYFLDPLSTKPISFYQNNIIAVPMGLLKKGIHRDVPEYVTLARVGFQIAREIFRHFDLIGKAINIKLNENTIKIYTEFRKHTLKKIEKSAVVFQETNNIAVNLNNTNLPVNEVIRTDAAFRLISELFKRDEIEHPYLTHILGERAEEQIFEIILAQEFCEKQEIGELAVNLLETMRLPGELLVNNFALSSEKFDETFSCGPGREMNPPEILKLQFPHLSVLKEEQNYS